MWVGVPVCPDLGTALQTRSQVFVDEYMKAMPLQGTQGWARAGPGTRSYCVPRASHGFSVHSDSHPSDEGCVEKPGLDSSAQALGSSPASPHRTFCPPPPPGAQPPSLVSGQQCFNN